MHQSRTLARASLIVALFVAMLAPTLAQDAQPLTVYSGRNESLIAPLIEQFTQDTGIAVQVLYGSTDNLAAQILEEGSNSPADIYIAQDAGALGALAKAERLAVLPEEVLERIINPAFVSPDGVWVGLSGRARVLVIDPAALEAADLEAPESLLDLANEEWAGLVGWAPTNASFRSNVTAMRLLLGDEATLDWLEGMVANRTRAYESNTAVVQGVINGEIAVGLVNHYYIFRFLAETPDLNAALYFLPGGDVGALVNVAGAAILRTSDQPEMAEQFVAYLLSDAAQEYFATQTFEYPLVAGVEHAEILPDLDALELPDIDLTDLNDLQGTIDLIEDSGALDH